MALFVGFLVLLLFLAALVYLGKPASAALDGILGRPILSPPELEFYHQLCRALPGLHVFPQVAANAILTVERRLPKAKQASLRNRYSQWHMDFTVCEPDTLRVVAIAEFDGKRHNAADDAWRDKVLSQGGYVVHRFRAKTKYADDEIAARFGRSHPPTVATEEQF